MGHLGGATLAGVGLGSILCGSFNWLFGFLSVLTIPKVASAMAQNKKERATKHIGQALWIAVLVGSTTLLLILAQAPSIVRSAHSYPLRTRLPRGSTAALSPACLRIDAHNARVRLTCRHCTKHCACASAWRTAASWYMHMSRTRLHLYAQLSTALLR
jgi:hypothetical protein